MQRNGPLFLDLSWFNDEMRLRDIKIPTGDFGAKIRND